MKNSHYSLREDSYLDLKFWEDSFEIEKNFLMAQATAERHLELEQLVILICWHSPNKVWEPLEMHTHALIKGNVGKFLCKRGIDSVYCDKYSNVYNDLFKAHLHRSICSSNQIFNIQIDAILSQ